jgi:hypothetical protein
MFANMKRVLLLSAALAQWLASSTSLPAQDDAAARAAAIAEREAAEERYNRLNSAVEGLLTSRDDMRQKLARLADEMVSVRAEATKTDTGKYVTREELKKIVEKIQEIDEKREADRKLILAEFENLKKEITQIVAGSASSSGRKARSTTRPETQEKPAAKPENKPGGGTPSNQEGVWYTIEARNTLTTIIAAHNEEFKKQGKKTSLKLIEDANPGIKATSLKVGQKIFIPLVSQ